MTLGKPTMWTLEILNLFCCLPIEAATLSVRIVNYGVKSGGLAGMVHP